MVVVQCQRRHRLGDMSHQFSPGSILLFVQIRVENVWGDGIFLARYISLVYYIIAILHRFL